MRNQINFNDIFKSSFLEKVSSVSLLDAAIAFGLAFCIGLFIYLCTRKLIKESCIQEPSAFH